MLPSLLASLTTAQWIVAVASAALFILSIAPVVWLCWRFVQMSDGEVANTVADVARFVELRDRARGVWR